MNYKHFSIFLLFLILRVCNNSILIKIKNLYNESPKKINGLKKIKTLNFLKINSASDDQRSEISFANKRKLFSR